MPPAPLEGGTIKGGSGNQQPAPPFFGRVREGPCPSRPPEAFFPKNKTRDKDQSAALALPGACCPRSPSKGEQ